MTVEHYQRTKDSANGDDLAAALAAEASRRCAGCGRAFARNELRTYDPRRRLILHVSCTAPAGASRDPKVAALRRLQAEIERALTALGHPQGVLPDALRRVLFVDEPAGLR